MNGIILIDKPVDLTSYDVIRKLKSQFPGYKIGHAGTLDPLASGLLIILVGKATKLSQLLMAETKTYSGTIVFGNHYDTYDIKGNIIKTKTPTLTSNKLDDGFLHFDNLTYQQIPPAFSALKIAGKKAYELARNKKEVTLAPREVTIHSFEKTTSLKNNEIGFLAVVSKQTYLRSLAVDLGAYLNEYAALKSLRRLKVGSFEIDDAYNIDNFEIISIKQYFKDYQQYKFDDFTTNLVKNGVWLDHRQTTTINDFVVLDENDEVIALYTPTDDNKYRPKIMF